MMTITTMRALRLSSGSSTLAASYVYIWLLWLLLMGLGAMASGYSEGLSFKYLTLVGAVRTIVVERATVGKCEAEIGCFTAT